MSVAPSGWYQDPYGEAPFRFWDGNIWTSATSPGARAAQSMAVQPLVAAPTRSAAVPTTDRDKGAALEQKVATLLRSMGYDVKTNVIITGRSGARHELDVVGEKSDQLTTFRVAVECKAWEQPIEKDVVAKFSYVLGDIGMREGIVACLGGYRSGAEVAARELGVQLWGPDELQSRLGAVAMSDMSTRAPQRVASGLPSGMTLAQAGPLFVRPVARVAVFDEHRPHVLPEVDLANRVGRSDGGGKKEGGQQCAEHVEIRKRTGTAEMNYRAAGGAVQPHFR